jgi:Uma2 family endonuclease
MIVSLERPDQMTADAFLRWEPGDGQRYELVDGQPRAMAPANVLHGLLLHGLLQSESSGLIRDHLRRQGKGCQVITAPGVIPRVLSGVLSADNVRVPDLGVTCTPVRLGQQTITDPILLIEILSTSNRAETWSNVWTYTSIPSVREILVLLSDAVGAHLLGRDATGAWPETPERITDGDLVLSAIGFRVPLADIYVGTDLIA